MKPVKNRWHVLTIFVSGHAENCWHENDELLTFPTRRDAEAELTDYLRDLRDEVKAGNRDRQDVPRRCDFIVERVPATATENL